MLPVVPPFLIGLVAAPLLKRLGKPVMRGIVKTSVSLGIEVKRAVHEAGRGIQDLAAEATAEVLAVQMAHRAEPTTDTHTNVPKSGTAVRAESGGGSAPPTAPAHAAHPGGEGKAVGKARGAGAAAAKVR
ncbi:DUF5132 domain-containing protein [Streptomyces bobili]|uniref:DUF5132 domain-containing protein n=1 Tax=Streptomyces bobili TaxID=67280 RepID=UPI0033D69B95